MRRRVALATAGVLLLLPLSSCAADPDTAAEDAVTDVLTQLAAGEGVTVATSLQLEIDESDALLLSSASETISDVVVGDESGQDTYGDDDSTTRVVHATWTLAGESYETDFVVRGEGDDLTVTIPEGTTFLTSVSADSETVTIAGASGTTFQLLPGAYPLEQPEGILTVGGAPGDTVIAAPDTSVSLTVGVTPADLDEALSATDAEAAALAAATITACQPADPIDCTFDAYTIPSNLDNWQVGEPVLGEQTEFGTPQVFAAPEFAIDELGYTCSAYSATGTGTFTNEWLNRTSDGTVTIETGVYVAVDDAGTTELQSTRAC